MLPSSSLVGRAIRARRESAGLTPQWVARRSGLSVAPLGAIESGRIQASIGMLGRIADALDSTLVDLVRQAGQVGGATEVGRPLGLGLPDVARAIADLPHHVGSKVDAAISAAVLHAVEACSGNQSAAARLLVMERKAFVRRLGRARRNA